MAGYSREKHKPFKGGKRRNKSASEKKGRVETKRGMTSASGASGCISASQNKANRKNAAKVSQRNKRQILLDQARIFSGINGAPKIVTIIPISPCDGNKLSMDLLNVLSSPVAQTADDESFRHVTKNCAFHRSERFRSNFLFTACNRKLLDILPLVSVSDFLILAINASDVNVDEWARQCLKSICAYGIPNLLPVFVPEHDAPDSASNASSSKKHQAAKKEWSEFFKSQYGCTKVHDVSNVGERYELERIISQQQLKPIHWRDSHPYMVSNSVSFQPQEGSSNSSEEIGMLVIKGHMRGSKPFSANHDVYVHGYGQFPLLSMKSTLEESKIIHRELKSMDVDDSPISTTRSLSLDTDNDSIEINSRSESFYSQNATTPPNGNIKTKKTKSKASMHGVSDYQAAWIIESDSEEELSADDTRSSKSLTDMDLSDYSEDSAASEWEDDDMEQDIEQEADDLIIYKKSIIDSGDKIERDREFPDYVDLEDAQELSARVRLQKYRGVTNLRQIIWEDDGFLPSEYENISQFDNFRLSEHRALHGNDQATSDSNHFFTPGEYVCLYLGNFPLRLFESLASQASTNSHIPLACFGLLLYEDLHTVLQFSMSKSMTTWTEPIRSKESFIAICGYRIYEISPLFSEPISSDSKKSSLSKYLRYLHFGTGKDTAAQTVLGTAYGHVQFGSPPILLFKTSGNSTFPVNEQDIHLAMTGVLRDMNPSHCIIKRAVLAGHPFKIHKKSAVVRFMFFSPDDVKHFKKIPLYTKNGKQGQIISSLGTHGYMKCAFNKQLQQQELVCMSLYRRVFPKWNHKELIQSLH
jgi:pre-rRNA-processing protein TSR1